MTEGKKSAKFYDVFFVGFCLMVSGVPSVWNTGLAYGFWEYFTVIMIISCAYLCYAACLAEMTSILPFSGGSYGFARVTMGPYFGFVIGCFDSVSNIYYSLLIVQYVCLSITDFMGDTVPSGYEPLQWFLMYSFCILLHLGCGRHNFFVVTSLGLIVMAILLMYVLSTVQRQDFHRYVVLPTQEENKPMFYGGIADFMSCLPLANWMYLGVDMMCLVCDDVENAKQVVPRSILSSMVVTVLISMSVIVCAAAQSPGFRNLSHLPFPLDPGFSAVFGLSEREASVFMLPVVFGGLYCLQYVYARQICAMARSKLLPEQLTYTTKHNVPYVALLVGTLAGYLLGLIAWFAIPHWERVLNYVYFSSLMCTIAVYLTGCLCFVVFRLRYGSLERNFYNHLGIGSAVVSAVVFSFSFVGAAGFSDNGGLAAIVWAVLVALISLFYYFYARRRQTFSPEEKEVMLKAYVMKENTKYQTVYDWVRRKMKIANRRVGPASTARKVTPSPPAAPPAVQAAAVTRQELQQPPRMKVPRTYKPEASESAVESSYLRYADGSLLYDPESEWIQDIIGGRPYEVSTPQPKVVYRDEWLKNIDAENNGRVKPPAVEVVEEVEDVEDVLMV